MLPLLLLGFFAGTSTGTIVVSGVQGNTAIGTLAPATSPALTGVSSTGSKGSVGVNVTVALTGVEATGGIGSISAGGNKTVALTGVSATGSIGSFTVVVTATGTRTFFMVGSKGSNRVMVGTTRSGVHDHGEG